MQKVEICGIDTSKLPTLKPQEMRTLLFKAQNGDTIAKEQLIYGNLRLVLSVVQRFSNRNEQADDLFQVGCIGLIKAINGFDLNMDVRFSTYAVPMIAGEIRRHMRDYNAVRVSRSLRDLAYKAMCAKNALTEKHGKEPTVAAIAKEIGANEQDVVFALDAIADPVSLYEPVYHSDEDTVCLLDQIRDRTEGESAWLNSIALSNGLQQLNERERKILKLRYFGCRTQMEVAHDIGISQAQVSRLEKSALRSLRKFVEE